MSGDKPWSGLVCCVSFAIEKWTADVASGAIHRLPRCFHLYKSAVQFEVHASGMRL